MTRRSLLASAAGAALAGCAGAPPTAVTTDASVDVPVTLRLREGVVQGRSRAEVNRFLGIPFAAPPVGGLRWRPPAPLSPWRGVRDASRFSAAAIQHVSWPNGYYPFEQATSEDCLYLNVWAPRRSGPHPVHVWIHGGGNVAGTTHMPITDGSAHARAGIVFVSIQYRLGALGLLELGELLGPGYAGTGNLALLDQIAALQWVARNIEAFGGDPGQVTIGGQSAGAKNAATLLAMPAARGLFHRAVIESGGAQTVATLDEARSVAVDFLRCAALDRGDARALLKMDAPALLRAQQALIAGADRKYPFRAVVDGVHLPQVPVDAVASGAARDIAVLAGTAHDEVAFWGPTADGLAQVHARDLANMGLEAFERHARQYPALMPDADPERRRYRALTAEEYAIPTLRLAEAQAGAGGQLWLYRWDLAPLQGCHAGFAVHGSEMPLVLGNLSDPTAPVLGATDVRAHKLAVPVFEAWTGFIHGRPPAAQGLPPWPPYALDRRPLMRFDAQPELLFDPEVAEREIWADWRR